MKNHKQIRTVLCLALSLLLALNAMIPGVLASELEEALALGASRESGEPQGVSDDADLPEEYLPGLMAEYFKASANRNSTIEAYTFDNKSGEGIMPVLNGTSLLNVLKTFNGTDEYATAKFTGMINVPKEDSYTFYGYGDDGFRIWVDGELIIDFWELTWEVWQTSDPVELTAGLHEFRVEYLQAWGGASLKIEWEADSLTREIIPAHVFFHNPQRADTGLTMQIYRNNSVNHISGFTFKNETGVTVLPSLDGSDLTGVLEEYNGTGEYASAIIHGSIVPEESGDYTFTMSGDDAYRLWIDDVLLIDAWTLNLTGEKTSRSISLVEGKLHSVKIHYAQATGDANLSLWWSMDGDRDYVPESALRQAVQRDPGDTQVTHGILAEVYEGLYWNQKNGETILPNLQKNHDWSGLIRGYNGSSEYATIRFSGYIEVEQEEAYTFHVIGDDGFRVWINGELIIDFWRLEWDVMQDSDPVTLHAGKNELLIEYQQGYGGCYIDVQWSRDGGETKSYIPDDQLYPADLAKGIIGEYYSNNPSNDPDDYTFANKTGERLSERLDFDNETLSQILLQNNGTTDDAVIRWTASLQADHTGDYVFTMEGNDGYRVYVDGALIIDNWTFSDRTTATDSAPVQLQGGLRSSLMVELLQKTGDVEARLYWQRNGGQKEIVPASALFTVDRVWYDRVVAKNRLALSIATADALYEATAVGAEIGQVSQQAKDDFRDEIAAAKEIWRDFDASAEAQIEAAETLDDCISKFRFHTVQSPEGQELTQFNNALYQGQDPFITYRDGYYYLVSSSNDPDHGRMYVSKSKSLVDQGERVLIFDFRGMQNRIFAPEMFFIDGKWYIYYCADVGVSDYGWKHQACVLESVTDDPQGEWIDRGVIYTGTGGENRQANDFTVFQYDGELYACWGSLGEPAKPDGGHYGPAIAKMESPIKISQDRSWLPGHGGEGPRAIVNDGKVYMTVSQGDFKSAGYRLGMYTYDPQKGDILDENSWTAEDYVFHGTAEVYGPARASFFQSADGTENWMAFHSKVYPANSNAWRQVSIKQFRFDENGAPVFDTPVSPYEFMALPSGDPGIGTVYQAEAAAVLGDAEADYRSKGFQGVGYVDIPDADGSGVSFQVEAPRAGDYLVRVRYANGHQNGDEWKEGVPDMTPVRHTLGLYVGDERQATVQFDKTETDWQHWMTACNRVTLDEGANTITYRKDASDSGIVYIDYIAVQEAHESPAPQTEKTLAELRTLITQAKAIQQGDVEDTHLWNVLQYAVEAAEKMGSGSSGLAIANRWLCLQVAMEDATAQPVIVDKTKLIELIEEAESIDPAGYTPESLQVFNEALANAITARDTDVPQETVDAAARGLREAIDALEPIGAVIPVESIQINNAALITLGKGETLKLSATVTPANASGQVITWVSSTPTIATIDENGVVKGIKSGTVRITATTSNGKTAAVAVRITA